MLILTSGCWGKLRPAGVSHLVQSLEAPAKEPVRLQLQAAGLYRRQPDPNPFSTPGA